MDLSKLIVWQLKSKQGALVYCLGIPNYTKEQYESMIQDEKDEEEMNVMINDALMDSIDCEFDSKKKFKQFKDMRDDFGKEVASMHYSIYCTDSVHRFKSYAPITQKTFGELDGYKLDTYEEHNLKMFTQLTSILDEDPVVELNRIFKGVYQNG